MSCKQHSPCILKINWEMENRCMHCILPTYDYALTLGMIQKDR